MVRWGARRGGGSCLEGNILGERLARHCDMESFQACSSLRDGCRSVQSERMRYAEWEPA